MSSPHALVSLPSDPALVRSDSGSAAQTVRSTLPAPFRWAPIGPDRLPVRVVGTAPDWLRGQLMRVCPAVFDHGGYRAEHWFDGLGLLYMFELGPEPGYRQRLLESNLLAQSGLGRNEIASFDTSIRRSLLQRVLQPVPTITDNANVNVIPWQGDWLAMTEVPAQHVIDGETLRTRGRYDYEDALGRHFSMTAHPHFDRSRNALVNVGVAFGPTCELVVYRQRWSSNKREVEGRLALRRRPYLHSFGLSERHAVIIEHPFSVNPLRALFSQRGFIQHFRWDARRGTRLWKFERDTGRFTPYEAEGMFCFHTVNTFEDDADVVCDFLAFPDPSIIAGLRRERITEGYCDILPKLMRARLSPGAKRARLEQLSSTRFDLPQIAYRAVAGKPYGHVWGTCVKRGSRHPWASEVVRVELSSDRVTRFSDPDYVMGEPVHVPRAAGGSETDGVVLVVGTHVERDHACLFVLDANRLEPLARYEVDAAIPLGFHGNFAFKVP